MKLKVLTGTVPMRKKKKKGKGATNADGTIHDSGKGAPKWSNKAIKWLRNYGFNI